eukprot:g41000.t1
MIAESMIVNLKESVASDAGRYDITAANSSGTTKSFVIIVVLDRPGPPVGPVNISDVTESSVTLRWQPPTYDGGSQVTNYIVLKRETSTAAWSEVSATAVRSIIKVMKLTTGEEYQFRIKAENRFGISDHIDSKCVVVKLPYKIPTNLHVTDITKTSVSLSWKKPAYDGGSKITGYIVERRDLPNGRWTKASFTNVIETQFTVSGLTQDAQYEFRIFAKNAIGSISNPSEIVGPVTCHDTFGAPQVDLPMEYTDIVKVKAGSAVKLKVGISGKPLPSIDWFKNNKELETGSQVFLESTTDSTAVIIKDATRINSGSYEIKLKNAMGAASGTIRLLVLVRNIIKGNEYVFRVRAVNKYGVGDPLESDPVIAKNAFAGAGPFSDPSDFYKAADPIDQPGQPTKLKIVDSTKSSITLGWTKPVYDGGSTITSYMVEMREADEEQWAKLHIKHVTRGTVTLVWEAPLVNGGAEITNYVIEKRDATKRAWSIVTNKCSSTMFKITGLSEKNAFYFRVLAENENGLGEPCETSEAVKATEVPGPIKDLAMLDSTKSSVTLQWNKPDYDGGSLISEYVIEKKLKEAQEWSPAGICKVCIFEITNLKELAEMEFRVFAKNEKGLSDGVVIGPITVKDYVITPEADLSDIPGGQIRVRIGHNVHIELPYKGKPKPTLQWQKDNIPLKESEHLRYKKTENKAILSIKNIKKEN